MCMNFFRSKGSPCNLQPCYVVQATWASPTGSPYPPTRGVVAGILKYLGKGQISSRSDDHKDAPAVMLAADFSPAASTMLPSVWTTIRVAFWALRPSPSWRVVLLFCQHTDTQQFNSGRTFRSREKTRKILNIEDLFWSSFHLFTVCLHWSFVYDYTAFSQTGVAL